MKKSLLLLFAFCAISCHETQPIEKYKGRGLVVIEAPLKMNKHTTILTLKNKEGNMFTHSMQ